MKTYAARTMTAICFTGACLLGSTLFMPSQLYASDISARYIQAQGKQLVIEITAGPNPPALTILIQKFPDGVTMLSSAPPPNRYSAKKNKAKWLFRNLAPGKTKINMTLDRPVSSSEISAEVHFKPQQGGETLQVPVSK